MKNFFELFALKLNFEIDEIELEKKYLDFQKQFHPDISSSADIEKSIAINEAYKTLSDDFLRACYLLALKNIDIRQRGKIRCKTIGMTPRDELESSFLTRFCRI